MKHFLKTLFGVEVQTTGLYQLPNCSLSLHRHNSRFRPATWLPRRTSPMNAIWRSRICSANWARCSARRTRTRSVCSACTSDRATSCSRTTPSRSKRWTTRRTTATRWANSWMCSRIRTFRSAVRRTASTGSAGSPRWRSSSRRISSICAGGRTEECSVKTHLLTERELENFGTFEQERERERRKRGNRKAALRPKRANFNRDPVNPVLKSVRCVTVEMVGFNS